MNFHKDNNGALYVEWQQGPTGGFKRAWIRTPAAPDKDWAGTGRYINVAMIPALGAGPGGPSADFPIFNALLDEQVLVAFVAAVCGVTGCPVP